MNTLQCCWLQSSGGVIGCELVRYLSLEFWYHSSGAAEIIRDFSRT